MRYQINFQMRVLYSFPYRIGAGRICDTAWQQVNAISLAGAEVSLLTGSVHRPLEQPLRRVLTTLSKGPFKIPYRMLGRRRALHLHDLRTANWLSRNAQNIDIFHGWPGSSLRTLKVAKEHGIPTLLERPNAHTEYAFEVSESENRVCEIPAPKGHDHTYCSELLSKELKEYDECDFLLCPSQFVKNSFVSKGTEKSKLLEHHYGFDESQFTPQSEDNDLRTADQKLNAIYVGSCEPRKGLHYILKAWLHSEAANKGKLKICGEFVPHYRESLGEMLAHPSIEVLGFRSDIPDLMRSADIFLLSSVEEGSALVTYEARASGCILLVSDATGAPCEHGENALVHPAQNWKELAKHLDQVLSDNELSSEITQEFSAEYRRFDVEKNQAKFFWSAITTQCYLTTLSSHECSFKSSARATAQTTPEGSSASSWMNFPTQNLPQRFQNFESTFNLSSTNFLPLSPLRKARLKFTCCAEREISIWGSWPAGA